MSNVFGPDTAASDLTDRDLVIRRGQVALSHGQRVESDLELRHREEALACLPVLRVDGYLEAFAQPVGVDDGFEAAGRF